MVGVFYWRLCASNSYSRLSGMDALAEKVGITVAALSRIERNSAEPRPKTRRNLAEALGVDPSELVE
jgi:transcriptional regulator with XRE-family HTH domain